MRQKFKLSLMITTHTRVNWRSNNDIIDRTEILDIKSNMLIIYMKETVSPNSVMPVNLVSGTTGTEGFLPTLFAFSSPPCWKYDKKVEIEFFYLLGTKKYPLGLNFNSINRLATKNHSPNCRAGAVWRWLYEYLTQTYCKKITLL